MLYATTPKLNVVALNAGTGRVALALRSEWLARKVLGRLRSRGLSYWSSGADARIFVAVRQYLYALDARTGQPVRRSAAADASTCARASGRDPSTLSVTMSTPGVVWRDVLIVGSAVSELPPAAPGDIRGFDVRTGRLLWSFHTIPHPGEPGYDTWPPDAWRTIGGANSWAGCLRSTSSAGSCSHPPDRRPSISMEATARATTCLPTRSLRSTQKPAGGYGTSRPSDTTSGTATCPRPRRWSPSGADHATSMRSRRSRSRALFSSSIGPPVSRCSRPRNAPRCGVGHSRRRHGVGAIVSAQAGAVCTTASYGRRRHEAHARGDV